MFVVSFEVHADWLILEFEGKFTRMLFWVCYFVDGFGRGEYGTSLLILIKFVLILYVCSLPILHSNLHFGTDT